MNYAEELLKKVLVYDAWINRGLKGDIPNDIRIELLKLFNEDPEAYSFYRNQIFYLAKTLLSETNVIDELLEMLNKAEKSHPLEFRILLENLSKKKVTKSYNSSRLNMIEVTDSLKDSSIITQNICFLYQLFYEIDTIFIVLGSLSELAKNKTLDLDLNSIKDIKGNIKKGVAIEFIRSRIKNYPSLLNTFEVGYNSKLRNTIGHNKYIREDNEIRSEDGKIKVGIKDLMKSIWSLQEIDNAMINALSLKEAQKKLSTLSNCGILGISFALDGEKPVLAIFQLWCFYEIDIQKEWLKKACFTVDQNLIYTDISGKTNQKGVFSDLVKDWIDRLASIENKELETIVTPIRPITSENTFKISLDCGTFELTGEDYTKIIPYSIN